MGFIFNRPTPEHRFWRWFQANTDRILHFEQDREKVFDDLARELKRVNEHLTFEFGSLRQAPREFVVSAGGIREAFPAVQKLVAAAPDLPGWLVVPFRPPKSLDLVLEIGHIRLSADDLWFEAFEDGDRVALAIYLPGYSEDHHELFGHAAFIMLDSALGEYAVETRVGGVELRAVPQDPDSHGLSPFRDIPALFDPIAH